MNGFNNETRLSFALLLFSAGLSMADIKNTADANGCRKTKQDYFPDSTPHICDSRTDIIPSAQISRDAALPHFGVCPFHGTCPARPLITITDD